MIVNVIEVKKLCKSYGAARGITDIDLEVKEGEIFGFIGPNGAGKSTTIGILMGLIFKISGEANIFGLDVEKEKEKILLILLFVAGSMEFEGIAGANSESIEVVLNYYPPIILALMGITEAIDFSRLDGYTWVLSYLATVMGAFYAITLGMQVISRELIDKTFEFLFTKPRKRKHILSIKICAGWLCLTGIAIIHFGASLLIMNPLDQQIDISKLMLLSTLGMYLTTLVFYALAIFVSVWVKERNKGSKILNTFFLLSIVLGGVYDVTSHAEGLRLMIPLRYFIYQDASKGMLNMWYVILSVVLIGILLVGTYRLFEKQDLTEI